MRQPESPDEKLRSLQALVACPTASIGGAKGAEVEEALATFPQRIAGPAFATADTLATILFFGGSLLSAAAGSYSPFLYFRF